jgi:hypothetical protein
MYNKPLSCTILRKTTIRYLLRNIIISRRRRSRRGELHPEDEPHKEFRIAELNGKLNELLIKENTKGLDPDEESLKKQIIESLGNNRRGGGRRRSKKRPTARRRRSSKRKARKSRITRRR